MKRLHINQRKDSQAFARVTNNPFYKQCRPILRDLFDKSLQANYGNYSPLELQAELLGYILFVDSARKKYLRWKDLFGKALSRLTEHNAPLERIKRTQSRIKDIQRYATSAEWVGGQLRSIGDGIAWRFLKYDRAALRLLAEHDYVSVPSLGTGLYEEMNEVQRLADEGYSLLLNSITNFLRVGDITIYDKTTGKFKIVEVKAGMTQTPRTIRQGKYMALVQEGLDEGSHSIAGATLTKMMSKAPLLTYVRSVESAMVEAEQKFGSSRLFGEYLSVGVFALRKIIDNLSGSDMQRVQHTIIERCMSVLRRKTDMPLPIMSNISPMVHFSPILAPYTIFPIDRNRRFDLLTGDFWVISQLNISGLARWLESRGWETKIVALPDKVPDSDEFPHVPILQVWKGKKGIEIGLDILAIAAMEFWIPESIERMIVAIFNEGIPESGFYSVNFPSIGKYAWD